MGQTEIVNQTIVSERMEIYNRKQGVRVGDYIIRKNGKVSRATHDWGNEIQDGGHEHGRFYLGQFGISYSGGLDEPIEKSKLHDTGEKGKGDVWIFSNNHRKAGNGVTFRVNFRIFKEK